MSARTLAVAWRFVAWACPRWLCVTGALLAGGCGTWQGPRLDPTGEHIFLPAGSPMPPFPPGASPLEEPIGPAQSGVSLSPSQVIAPVNSEVVMIASVGGGEGFLLTNEPVEWSIAPDGVGQFLSPGERRPLDLLNWARGLPIKLGPQYAMNATLFRPMRLDRGTPMPFDDILVQGGQAWVSVISPNEGTSRVTAFVPGVYGWDRRQQTASIYWVDAEWRFPPPAISNAGDRNSLVTTLARQTNKTPLAGWTVRYEIAGGPEAGFAPDGASSVEVLTGEAGQAAAEIIEKQAVAGTNQISIQIIRPAGFGGQTQPLTIGVGSTLQTWASSGPPTTTTAPPSFAPAPRSPAPPVSAPAAPTPPAAAPAIAPQAPAARPSLDITINGPESGTIGENVQFQIDVVNRGTTVARRLVVTDRFGAGLKHAISETPIQRDLIDLQPGATARLSVNFRVTEAGQQCQDVEVTAEGEVAGTARHCLAAAPPAIAEPAPGEQRWEPEPPAGQPAPFVPPGQQPRSAQPPAGQSRTVEPPAERPRTAGGAVLTLRKTGPDRKRVGESALFTIELTNRSDQSIEDVVIADHFETTLEPGRATEGNQWLEGNALGWKVGTMQPGSTVKREIEFKCLQATPRACNRVTVTAKDIQPLADEACLEVVGAEAPAAAPAAGAQQPLRVSVAETTDPVRVGGTTTYQILLENKDAQSYFDVAVSASLSEELRLNTIASPVGTQGQVLPNAVRFTPVRELRAGEATLSFELHVTAIRAGAARVTVEVKSKGQARAVTAEQTTQVVP